MNKNMYIAKIRSFLVVLHIVSLTGKQNEGRATSFGVLLKLVNNIFKIRKKNIDLS